MRHPREQGGLSCADAQDAADVRRCLGGDGQSYRCIVARNQAMVSRLLWRFSRDAEVHEDLVQECFIEAYQALTRYRGTGPFRHWLGRIAVRVGYRHWKRERRRRAPEVVSVADLERVPDAPADEPADCAAAAETLFRLLAKLSPRDRLVLTLRYVEDCSVERTAELTGWSQTMVKVQSLRARTRLRTLFERAEREAAG